MKVYITISGERHEGYHVTGVYLTREDALGAKPKEALGDTRENNTWWLNGVDYWGVLEEDVEIPSLERFKEITEATIHAMEMEAKIRENINEEKLDTLAKIFGVNREEALRIFNENSKVSESE